MFCWNHGHLVPGISLNRKTQTSSFVWGSTVWWPQPRERWLTLLIVGTWQPPRPGLCRILQIGLCSVTVTNLIHKISKHGFSAHRFWIVHSPNRLHYLQSTTHAQGKVTDVPALNVWVFVDEHHQQQRRYGFVVEQILGWLVFASKFFGPDSAHYRWFWRHTQSGWKCFPTYVKIGVFMSLKQDFETKCCQYCCSHVMTLDFGHAIFRGIESTFAVFLDICCNFERKTSKQEILCVKSHWPPIHLPQPPPSSIDPELRFLCQSGFHSQTLHVWNMY